MRINGVAGNIRDPAGPTAAPGDGIHNAEADVASVRLIITAAAACEGLTPMPWSA